MTAQDTSPKSARGARVERYDPASIEPRWQQRWDELGLYRTDLRDTSRPTFYLLTMYPYPSGDLHIGHWYIKTPTDAIARFHRMHGENVFLPIGFDAFGLPAENAAIKNNINPRDWTMANIENMRRQLRTMGATFDWEAEVVTADPDVLPLEPVAVPAVPEGRPRLPPDVAGRLVPERRDPRARAGRGRRPPLLALRREGREARPRRSGTCGSRTTPTSCSTSRGIDWPEPIKTQQTNWIGRSEGGEIVFDDRAVDAPRRRRRAARLHDPPGHAVRGDVHGPRARSTRSSPTLTAPDRRAEVERVRRPGRGPDRDRPAVDGPREDRRRDRRRRDQPGQRRADPDLRRRLRPRRLRDGRDHGRPGPRRARLRVRGEVRAADPAGRRGARRRGSRPAPTARTSPTRPASGSSTAGRTPACRPTRAAPRSSPRSRREGKGKAAVTYRLRDWLISRQRYWGTPIPVIYCPTDGIVPVPEEDLPVRLPGHRRLPRAAARTR